MTIILVVSVALMGAGLYSLWHASSTVLLVLVGLVILVMGWGAIKGSNKNKAVRFFQAYQQLQIYRPTASPKELIEETIRFYLKGTQRQDSTDAIIHVVTDNNRDFSDIKGVAHLVLVLEEPNGADFSTEFDRYLKQAAKRNRAIDEAYKKVFASGSVDSRPVLTEGTVKRMKEQGMDPDNMSNEQLAALASLEDATKSHWLAKTFSYAGYGAGLLGLIRLLALDIPSVIVYAVIAFVFMFIGFKIQSRIAGKKFHQASIRKWAEEQRQTAQK